MNNCGDGCAENFECIFVDDSMECVCLEAFLNPQTGECLTDKGNLSSIGLPVGPPLGIESASLRFSLSILLYIYIFIRGLFICA